MALYSKIAAKAFEPVGEETGEVSYETSLAQVTPDSSTKGWSFMINIEIDRKDRVFNGYRITRVQQYTGDTVSRK